MDSDGFTINWVASSEMVVQYLALGGDAITNVKTGSASAKTSSDVAANNDAAQAHARASFGWATGTTARGSYWIGETDNVRRPFRSEIWTVRS